MQGELWQGTLSGWRCPRPASPFRGLSADAFALTLVFSRELEDREELLSSTRPSFPLLLVNTNIFDNSDPSLPNFLPTSHDPSSTQSVNMTSQVTPSKTVRSQLPPRLPYLRVV